MDARCSLKKILVNRCLEVGPIRLSTGRQSEYYLDVKQATLDPEGAYFSAWLILEELQSRGIPADAIGGLSLGADPIVAAVAALSFVYRDRFTPLPGFIVRKKRKAHGTCRQLEGHRAPRGASVVVVDDVCTTGGSIKKAIDHAENKGYRVSAVISIVDRDEGATETLGDYEYFSLFQASELLAEPTIQTQLKSLA